MRNASDARRIDNRDAARGEQDLAEPIGGEAAGVEHER
jgi:hypothetical protein